MFLLKNKRFWVDAAMFALVFVGAWWLALALALAAAFYFRRFIELVALGVLLDSLYSGPAVWFGNFPYALTLACLVALIVINYSKTFLRFSS